MSLTWEERMFVLVLLVNLLVALIYLLVGALVVSPMQTRKARKAGEEVRNDNRRTYLIRFVVMVLCPVIGPLFFLCAYVLFRLPLWMKPHLDDVVFSKDRVEIRLLAEEDRERDIVPLEEALFLNKGKDLRVVMLNTIRGDVHSILGVIMLALNSEDSETAHYAASVLSGELDAYRARVRQLRAAIAEEVEREQEQQQEEKEVAAELELISYMDDFLRQKVFSKLEQEKQLEIMLEAAESAFTRNAARMTEDHYAIVCQRLIDAEMYEEAEKWCQRLAAQYPDCLAAYTCRLKLYFSTQNREKFFSVMSALKKSEVVIDQETLELVKAFG